MRKLHSTKLLRRPQKATIRQLSLVSCIAISGLLGTWLLLDSHAATPVAYTEAENGIVSSSASTPSDSSASGNKAVKFGGGSTSTDQHSCPAYPAFPDASCTGVPSGITLTPSGSVTITTPNVTIQNLDITGTVTVAAANVTIQNCKIHSNGGGGPGISITSGNAIIKYTEIYGFADEGIGFGNWAGYNLNIHNMFDDGAKLGSNTTLQDSYLHDYTPSPGSHADGAQMQSGESNINIIHNYIDGPDSALFFAPDLGPNSNGPVTIKNNLLGGGNYTLVIVDGSNGQYHEKNYSVSGNRFLRDYAFGPTDINEPASNFLDWSNNAYNDNGSIIGE